MQVRSLSFASTVQGQVLLATGFALITALGALVQIPIGPVPITLQVLFVLLSGLVLGSRLGALSQIEYLAIGFVAGAFVAGLIAESISNPGRIRLFIAGLLGTAAIYFSGATWLATWFAVGNGSSWIAEMGTAFTFGVLPFILVDGGKAIVASGVALSGRGLASLLK